MKVMKAAKNDDFAFLTLHLNHYRLDRCAGCGHAPGS
jgi:hypothetical protein